MFSFVIEWKRRDFTNGEVHGEYGFKGRLTDLFDVIVLLKE
jgi:hypothetical protein